MTREELKKQLIEVYQKELDFVNKMIDEHKGIIKLYQKIGNGDISSLINEILSDNEINSSMMTSYHFNLENYEKKKIIIEGYLERIKAI